MIVFIRRWQVTRSGKEQRAQSPVLRVGGPPLPSALLAIGWASPSIIVIPAIIITAISLMVTMSVIAIVVRSGGEEGQVEEGL